MTLVNYTILWPKTGFEPESNHPFVYTNMEESQNLTLKIGGSDAHRSCSVFDLNWKVPYKFAKFFFDLVATVTLCLSRAVRAFVR